MPNKRVAVLYSAGACVPALAWVEDQGGAPLQTLWDRCPRGEWMEWFHHIAHIEERGDPAMNRECVEDELLRVLIVKQRRLYADVLRSLVPVENAICPGIHLVGEVAALIDPLSDTFDLSRVRPVILDASDRIRALWGAREGNTAHEVAVYLDYTATLAAERSRFSVLQNAFDAVRAAYQIPHDNARDPFGYAAWMADRYRFYFPDIPDPRAFLRRKGESPAAWGYP